MNGPRRLVLLCAAAAAAVLPGGTLRAAEAPAWLSRVEPAPANVIPPRPFKATYRITWAGLTAARAEVDCTLPPDSTEVRTRLKTATVGMTRSLWQMDANHLAVANRLTMRPVRIEETDKREKKEITSRVEFPAQGAVRWTRTVRKGEPPDAQKIKPKEFNYPHMLDMHSALLNLLNLRNVPLGAGESHAVLVMTVTNPYLVTIKVLGRETVDVKAGKRAAVKCSLELGKIGKEGELLAQKKFKSATAWISDDRDRTLLKAEVKVFVGTVTLELEQMAFGDGAPPR